MSSLELAAFVVFALVTLGFSAGVVLSKQAWHAALSLGGALFSVAVHYVMLGAQFVAAMQVLVYVGGVLVLLAFAVMLTERDESPEEVTA
ncbi:NADH-ubiquinone oxidoreductase chain J [Halarchaeum acidiphilum MH1-52-1]|uniref:NADH-ubiquinone oxidoreductase chain J n=1 Tax=Halarchaeum acidiphilum MH1-52-1 TaxID=1261545 RepID=U2YEC9_9EURY|nr:NADH-quinone oxidoreductase subunit J [Halarchaeum acidiphilum]GAD52131.1 NADH-ubiquinone oxidoreductase chain J [Halarchaeum acidiphilum MH1-52-1]